MYKGLVIERKGIIVKSCMSYNVSVQVDGSGMILFYVYDEPVYVQQKELNMWINVDCDDIDSMMFCLIEE